MFGLKKFCFFVLRLKNCVKTSCMALVDLLWTTNHLMKRSTKTVKISCMVLTVLISDEYFCPRVNNF